MPDARSSCVKVGLKKAALWAWLSAGCVVLGGCNILGPAIYFVAGPEKVPAAFTLDPKRPTVVFIDDRTNRIPQRAIREMIGTVAERTILENEASVNMIESKRVQAVVARERFGKPMGIAEVGRALEAEVVIYAWVDEFSLSSDGQTFTPMAQMRMKVIDAVSKERLFPKPGGEEWHTVAVRVPTQQGVMPASNAEKAQAEENLARWTGRQLGRQFFEYNTQLDAKTLDERER